MTRRTRRSGPWGLLGVLLVSLAALTTLAVTNPERSGLTVARAAGELASAPAVRMRGAVVEPDGRAIDVDLTVTADGHARGALTGPSDARAEIVSNGEQTLLKGNTAWWMGSPHPGAATELADRWVRDVPATAAVRVAVSQLTPRHLAAALRTPDRTSWSAGGTREVGGVVGTEHRVGADRMAVLGTGADLRPRVLAVDVPVADLRSITLQGFDAAAKPEEGHEHVRFVLDEPDAAAREDLEDYVVGVLKLDIRTYGEITGTWRDAIRKDGAYGPVVADVVQRLTAAGRPDGQKLTEVEAVDLVERCVAARVFAALHTVATNLDRVANLRNLAEFRKQINIKGSSNRGNERHFEEFARLVRDPNLLVDIEGVAGDLLITDRGAGAQEAREAKIVVQPAAKNVLDAVKSATGQLNGLNGRGGQTATPTVIPVGAKRVVQLEATETTFGNLFDATRSEALTVLRGIPELHEVLFDAAGAPRADEIVINFRARADGAVRQHRIDVATELRVDPGTGGTGPSSGPLFGPPGSRASEGGLADHVDPTAKQAAPTAHTADDGGIDLTTVELRYLAEPVPGKGLRYAFTGPVIGTPDAEARLASDSFFVWLSLDPSTFWVNLNPDEPDRVIDAGLGRTDAGQVLLEADLQMKRTVGKLTHPDAPIGSKYWSALQPGPGGVLCSFFRMWARPKPASVFEDNGALYILDAPLDVAMETMYTSVTPPACRTQPQETTAHNEQVLRTTVLPELIKAVNTAPEYAKLRQVYLSRVAAEWYRQRSTQQATTYRAMVDAADVSPWASRTSWTSREVYDQYLKSVKDGEYQAVKNRDTPDGPMAYGMTYGGVDFQEIPLERLGPEAFRANHPDLAATVDQALDGPVTDGKGRRWLGARTPAPGEPPAAPSWPVPAAAAAVSAVVLAVGLGAVRRRRRARE